MKIVIINPTYNEKGNIERLITILEEEIFPEIKNHEMHILVADDSSPDGTGDAVKKLQKKYKNLHLNVGEKQGLGAAYIRAMTYAIDELKADVVFEMDADGQHDPKKVPDFIKKIEDGCDMVIGNRYSDGGSIPQNWPFMRKVYSVVANIFVRTVFMTFSIHDWTGGYRALKKEVFLKEKPRLTNYRGYIFQISFLHKAVRDHFKIGEVPFHFSDRTLGNSKIASTEYIIEVVKYVLISRIKELQRFIKFLVVGGTGFIVQVLFQEGSIALGIALLVAKLFTSKDPLILSHSIGAGIGAEAAILSNFMLNNFWTFSDTTKAKENSIFIVRLLKFNASSLIPIAIQAAAVGISEHYLGTTFMLFGHGIPVRIAILFPTILFLVIPLNYFIYNRFIWKTHKLKNESSSSK